MVLKKKKNTVLFENLNLKVGELEEMFIKLYSIVKITCVMMELLVSDYESI